MPTTTYIPDGNSWIDNNKRYTVVDPQEVRHHFESEAVAMAKLTALLTLHPSALVEEEREISIDKPMRLTIRVVCR